MDMFNAALEIDPNNTETLVNQAQAYFYLGKPDKAIAILNKALSIKSDYLPALRGVAKFSRATKKYLDSMKAYEKILKLQPNNLQALSGIADLYHQMGYYWQAIDSFNKILEKYPNFVPARIGIGMAYQKLALFEKAKESYLEALSKEPQNKVPQVYLKQIKLPNEDKVEQIKALEKMIIEDPGSSDLYLALISLYDSIGSRNRFLGSVYRLLAIDPNNIEGIRILAMYYENAGKYPDAVQYYLRLADLSPKDPTSHYRLGVTYIKDKQFDKAIEQLRLAVAVAPENPEYQFMLGSTLADREIMRIIPAIQTVLSVEDDPLQPTVDPSIERILVPPGIEPIKPFDIDKFLMEFDLDEAVQPPDFYEAIKHIRKAQWIYWLQRLKFWQHHPNAKEGLKRADEKLKIIYDVKKKF
jgi:tetratricopeptide (TPR) repeat protein